MLGGLMVYLFLQNPWWIFCSTLLIQGRHKLVWMLLVDACSGWIAPSKVMVRCPLCLECVLNIEFLWKRNDMCFTSWRVLQLIISQDLFDVDRCSSAVLLKMIMSSKYATAKLKSFKIPVINSWKYAGAWASPNGTLTITYLLKGELNAILGIEDLSWGMWS